MKLGFGLPLVAVVAVLLGRRDAAAAGILTAADRKRADRLPRHGDGRRRQPPRGGGYVAANVVVAPQIPLITAGPKASDVYENVQVLGDLSQAQFTRLMLAITSGCRPSRAAPTATRPRGSPTTLYTKRVSRWMIEMTRHINNDWQDHVKADGRDLQHLPPRQQRAGSTSGSSPR